MDGPSGLSGAVAALQNIKNPSKVAKKVLEALLSIPPAEQAGMSITREATLLQG